MHGTYNQPDKDKHAVYTDNGELKVVLASEEACRLWIANQSYPDQFQIGPPRNAMIEGQTSTPVSE